MSTETESPPSGRDRLAMISIGIGILTVIAAGFACYALRKIITPLLLSVFLLLVIGGLERALTQWTPLPRRAALPAAIVAVVALFGFSIWLIAENAAGIVEQSSVYAARLDEIIHMVSDRFGLQTAPTIDQLLHKLNPGRFASVVAREATHILDGAVFVLIYLAFMLASREGFRGKVERLFPKHGHVEAIEVAGRIQHGVQSYVWVQTVVGLIIAGASVLVMWPMGIPHLMFWAFLIFMANYIPAIGAAIGVVLPPVFALVDLNDIWRPILLFVLLEVIHFAVSHVVQPRMQGRSLNIDPIVVLISLAFWGAIFGIAGAFLSTPLTVVVMVVCNEFRATRWVPVLLSADGKPYANESKDVHAVEAPVG
ncbi:MAG: AI-2E family transporter [Caulobacteraceae bacterium]|nr:AI-2E family transporter [Caulobacteraceae bacterium]